MKKLFILILTALFFSSSAVYAVQRPNRSKREPVKKMSVIQPYEEEETDAAGSSEEHVAKFEHEDAADFAPAPDPGNRDYNTEEYRGDEEDKLPEILRPKSEEPASDVYRGYKIGKESESFEETVQLKSEQPKAEQAKPKPEIKKQETVKPQQPKPEQAKPEQAKPEPSKTEQPKPEPSKIEPLKTEPPKAEPQKTEPSKTEPKKAKVISAPEAGSSKPSRLTKPEYKRQDSESENGFRQTETSAYKKSSKRSLPALMTYSTSAEKVKELLKAGEDPTAIDEEGRSVLMYAAYLNDNTDPQVLKLLIDAGADVNAADKTGMTALMYASLRPEENGEFVRILIESGADASKKNKKGDTALKIALASQDKSKAGENDTVKHLLKANTRISSTASQNPADPAAMTELMKAVTVSFTPAKVKAIIDNGADIEERDSAGNTALMIASKYSNAEPVKTLIALGANVNAKNDAGQTPLMIACAGGYNPEKVKALIAAKSDVFDKDDEGRTALMIAAKNNSEPLVVKMLLDASSDPNDQDFEGRTPLMYAAFNSYRKPEILTLLMKAGAYVDITDNGGNTALHYTAFHNQYDHRSPALITILLEAHANINAKNGEGKTALDTAKESNNQQAAKFLSDRIRR